MAAMRLAPPTRMTYEEFLKADFGEQRVEWVDGEIDYIGTVSREHSDLVTFLLSLLRFFIDGRSLGSLSIEPFNMKLPQRPSGRNPDILFVSADHAGRISKDHLDGPADLVIEVVSPDDRPRDLVVKRQEYEAAGVLEYWILDPERKEAVFLVVDGNGHYVAVEPVEGIYRSRAIEGFWLRVDWLFSEPFPPMLDVFREWKLVP